MISIFEIKASAKNSKNVIGELRGLSTDTKPTNADNGCIFIEMDTGKIYFYDADNTRWLEFGVEAEPVTSNEETQGNE